MTPAPSAVRCGVRTGSSARSIRRSISSRTSPIRPIGTCSSRRRGEDQSAHPRRSWATSPWCRCRRSAGGPAGVAGWAPSPMPRRTGPAASRTAGYARLVLRRPGRSRLGRDRPPLRTLHAGHRRAARLRRISGSWCCGVHGLVADGSDPALLVPDDWRRRPGVRPGRAATRAATARSIPCAAPRCMALALFWPDCVELPVPDRPGSSDMDGTAAACTGTSSTGRGLASVPAGGVTPAGRPPPLRTASSRRRSPGCRRCGRRWRRS